MQRSLQRELETARDAVLNCIRAMRSADTALVDVLKVATFREVNSELYEDNENQALQSYLVHLRELANLHKNARTSVTSEILDTILLATSNLEEEPRAGQVTAETWHTLVLEAASSFFAELTVAINEHVVAGGPDPVLNSFADAGFAASSGQQLEEEWSSVVESVNRGDSAALVDVLRRFDAVHRNRNPILDPFLNIDARIRREWAAARGTTGKADRVADNSEKKVPSIPKNLEVMELIRLLQKGLPQGRSKIDIAREQTGNDRAAKNLLRQVRRFSHLLRSS